MQFQIDVSGPLSGLRELEQFPKAGLKRVMRQAANVIKVAEQHNAPFRTGLLRSSIITREERQKLFKVSFRVTFKPGVDKKGNVTKASKLGGKYGDDQRYYYPASQEYGWKMRNGEIHPGLHYARNSGDEVSEKVHNMIIDEFDKVIEQVQRGELKATGAIIRNGG